MTSISQRLLKNLSATSLGKGLNILTQLTLVPLFLEFWGTELYGEWLILIAIPAYLVVSDFGFGHAAANEMAIAVSQDNKSKALKIFQATSMLIFITFLIFGICFGLILLATPFDEWLGFSHIKRQEVLLVAFFLSVKIIVAQQFGLLHSAYRCVGRYAFGVMLENILIIFQFIGVVAALILGANPWHVALIELLVSMFVFVLVRWLLWVHVPWVCYGLPKDIVAVMKPILYPAFAFLLYPFTQLILIQGTTLLTGMLLGSTAVVFYTTIRMLGNTSLRLLEVITISMWPEFSVAFGKKNFVLMRKLHRLGGTVVFWLSVIGFTLLIFFGEFVYMKWTGNHIKWDQTFFILMILAVFAESLQIFSKVIPTATNQHVRMTGWLLINALISLPILWWFINISGLLGIPSMLFIHNVILSAVVLWYALHQLEEKPLDYFLYLVSPRVFYSNAKRVFRKIM